MAMKLLIFKDLRRLGIPYCQVHLARLEKSAKFPKRLRLGASRVAWLESEIQDWIKARADERNDATKPSLL